MSAPGGRSNSGVLHGNPPSTAATTAAPTSHTALPCPPLVCSVGGTLRVCSRGLYFVPRDVQQPIFRIPYAATTAIEA